MHLAWMTGAGIARVTETMTVSLMKRLISLVIEEKMEQSALTKIWHHLKEEVKFTVINIMAKSIEKRIPNGYKKLKQTF